MNRRIFLKGMVALGSVASSVVAKEQDTAPTTAEAKLKIGIIGLGKMGGYHLDKLSRHGQVVAVCDVARDRLDAAASVAGSGVQTFRDYRRLLECKNVQAVVIATPDHWHAEMTVAACEAGKDVYVETPAAHSIPAGRRMVEAARRNKVIVQVGAHGRSNVAARKACEFIRNGGIGTVNRIECWHPVNSSRLEKASGSIPDGLDWESWAGPLARMQFDSDLYLHWRNYLGVGGGHLCGMGAQILSLACWIMETDQTGPVAVHARASEPDKITGCPKIMDITWKFSNPDWELVWRQPGKKIGSFEYGAMYSGTESSLRINGGSNSVGTEQRAWDYKPDSGQEKVPFSPGHLANWMNCIKTRELPLMDIECGHRISTLCHLGNIAWQQGTELVWDPQKEKFQPV